MAAGFLPARARDRLRSGSKHGVCQPADGSSRRAAGAIRLGMRTGSPWRALTAARFSSSAVAERRFREPERPGVSERLRRAGLEAAHGAGAIDWGYLALDRRQGKAPSSRADCRGVGARPARAGSKWTAAVDRHGLVLSLVAAGGGEL